MKSHLKISLLCVVGLLTGVPRLSAQFPGPKPPTFHRSYLKLFGDNPNFSAQAEIRVEGSKETTVMPASFALLDGKTRMEMELSQMKSANMPPQAVAQMKQFGMDRMVTLTRPDKQINYLIYPGLKAYAEMPMGGDEAGTAAKEPKIEKTELGKETVDGHPCTKSKVIITDDDGKTHESVIWQANDLKDFPIKMEMKEKGSTVTMNYRNVQFTKPDAKLFEPPAGFTKYGSMQEMMSAAISRMMKAPGQP